jgi:hypothetical protein
VRKLASILSEWARTRPVSAWAASAAARARAASCCASRAACSAWSQPASAALTRQLASAASLSDCDVPLGFRGGDPRAGVSAGGLGLGRRWLARRPAARSSLRRRHRVQRGDAMLSLRANVASTLSLRTRRAGIVDLIKPPIDPPIHRQARINHLIQHASPAKGDKPLV